MKKITKLPNGRKKVQTIFDLEKEPSLVHPEFQAECDVNNIMRKFMSTGQINHLSGKTGTYGDFSEIPDYQGALETVLRAEKSFETLPSKIRARFQNDPQQLIEYLADPENTEESIKLGLRIKPKPSQDETPKPENTTQPQT